MYALSLYIYTHIHTPPKTNPRNPTLMIKAPFVRPVWPRACGLEGLDMIKLNGRFAVVRTGACGLV